MAEAAAELLKIKEARGASDRYMKELTGRLERFAADCRKEACTVTTAERDALWQDVETDHEAMNCQKCHSG